MGEQGRDKSFKIRALSRWSWTADIKKCTIYNRLLPKEIRSGKWLISEKSRQTCLKNNYVPIFFMLISWFFTNTQNGFFQDCGLRHVADLKSQKMTQCFILEPPYCVVRKAAGDEIRKWMNGFCTGFYSTEQLVLKGAVAWDGFSPVSTYLG